MESLDEYCRKLENQDLQAKNNAKKHSSTKLINKLFTYWRKR